LLVSIAFIQKFQRVDFELLAVTFAAVFDFHSWAGLMAHFSFTFRLLPRVLHSGDTSDQVFVSGFDELRLACFPVHAFCLIRSYRTVDPRLRNDPDFKRITLDLGGDWAD
jgi:hypothetical protein